ncbi:uncharacterized protein [Hoplias malabaricus]|uniref:uncharacterized protein n=1 Tax=Hoplias malabaricus TaxID=27720 RepID=UPI00346262C9
MFLTLLWLSWTFCCSFSLIKTEEVPAFFQNPPAIVLSKLNSSAELTCSTTHRPSSLSLKQRYFSSRELLYIHMEDDKMTFNKDFKHRLSVTRHGFNFTLHLSQLQIQDTDSYYCEWVVVNSTMSDFIYKQANETVIIVRDGDPEEECQKRLKSRHVLLSISVLITVTMFIICIGLITWRFRQSHQQHYSPYIVNHRHHQPQCPHTRR